MWRAGPLLHVIPTANHERLLVKISLRSPSAEAPHLRVDGRQVPGTQTDVAGRCFQFDVSNLGPATTYELQLVAPDGGTLSDPWPLKTHPAPDAEVDHLRILAYTCAGGYDGPPLHGQTIWLDMAPRRRLLARGLGFQPDVVIANGDQIYWRRAVVIQGDFHATAAGRITRAGELRLDRNPVEIVLVGTLGTGDLPFPSSFRKVNSTPSGTLDMDYAATDREERITIIDVTPGKMTFKLFVWRPPQPEDEIDTMEPVMTYEVKAGNRVPATKTHSSSTQGRSKHGNQTLQRRDQARCARFQT